MASSESVLEHIEKMKIISEQLQDIGDTVKESELCIILFSSLPDTFNSLITALETFIGDDETKLTWDCVRNTFLRDEDKRKYKEQ